MNQGFAILAGFVTGTGSVIQVESVILPIQAESAALACMESATGVYSKFKNKNMDHILVGAALLTSCSQVRELAISSES